MEIFGPSAAAADAPPETTRTEAFDGSVEPPVAHVALKAASRESVERVVAKAVAAGARVHTAPEDRELQGDVNLVFRIAMLVGLDGEIIEIMHTGQLDV